MSSFDGVGVAFNENTLLSTIDCDKITLVTVVEVIICESLVTVVVGLALLTAI